MRYTLIILSFLLVFSCNTTKQKEEKEVVILDFPSYSDSIVYSGCEEILSKTPRSFYFSIYEDTIIDLNTIDSRISIKLKFNWLYKGKYPEWPNNIGVKSIDILNESNIISNIDLTEITKIEAFPEKFTETGRYMEPVRDDIRMKDVNMDSYLDFIFIANCGKRCWETYYVYNPIKNIFEFHEKFEYLRPIYMDCNNQIVYSYVDGDNYGISYKAHKIEGNEIKLLQKKEIKYLHDKDYVLIEYTDNKGEVTFLDTSFFNR